MFRAVALGACLFGPAWALAEDRPLICFGNEPFWSLDLSSPDAAPYATPDGEPVLYQGAVSRLDFLGEAAWRGTSADGRELVLWMRNAECSDGMSDDLHPVTARLFLPDGQFRPGCCRVLNTGADQGGFSPLEGPGWRLTHLSGAEPSGLAALSQGITVRFAAGRVQGFSGCNRFAGGYGYAEGRLSLEPLAGTMMACPEPAMTLENTFREAFSGPFQVTIDKDVLLLTGESGVDLRFERLPVPRLAGSEWHVTDYNNGRQAVVGVTEQGDVTLSFTEDKVSGSAGCNRFGASYEVDGDRISIGPARSTRRACPEPLMTQEQQFLAALASVTTWRIDGNVLDMHRADGERAIMAVQP